MTSFSQKPHIQLSLCWFHICFVSAASVGSQDSEHGLQKHLVALAALESKTWARRRGVAASPPQRVEKSLSLRTRKYLDTHIGVLLNCKKIIWAQWCKQTKQSVMRVKTPHVDWILQSDWCWIRSQSHPCLRTQTNYASMYIVYANCFFTISPK